MDETQVKHEQVVVTASKIAKHSTKKMTRPGCRGGIKAKKKKQKMEETAWKNVNENYNTNKGGGQKKTKHGGKFHYKGKGKITADHNKLKRSKIMKEINTGKFKNKGMVKMEFAEHIKSNCSDRSMIRGEIKEEDTATISAAHNLMKSSDKMTKTNFEAHIKWTRGV